MQIIGRDIEIKELKRIKMSKRPEFLAIYGRRRIGKTFLVREFFDFDFYATGTANSPMKTQLVNFFHAISKYNNTEVNLKAPSNWFEAFHLLELILEEKKTDKKKIIFLDELPWLDTPRSHFIQALEYFWNSYASTKNIALIVCGSAASWMISHLIRNRGGLHNRLTAKLKLNPFTLKECEAYFKQRGAGYNRYQLIQLYMAIGGIPYYLDRIDTSLSATQNIHNLCFTPNGFLKNEFEDLYYSLFKKAENHLAIIEALGQKRKGLTRNEMLEITKLPNAGSTSRTLKELEESGFIREYLPFGGGKSKGLYQLVDFFSLFYLQFMKGNKRQLDDNWMMGIDDPKQRAWSGYAFAMICLQHITQIKNALSIGGIQTHSSSWIGTHEKKHCQIDLIIDRRDQVINLCEIKFSINKFTISKAYKEEIMNKIGVFSDQTGKKKSIFLTFITTFGLQPNEYSQSIVQNSLTMDDLF